MFLEKALNRRLLFVTGKGGVGKSTFSAALAKICASKRLRTALVELSGDQILGRHFGLSPNERQIEEISPYLTLHKLEAKYSLEEFVTEKFHLKKLYKALFDNRLVNYFLEATPGFSEFLIMSKLQKLAEHDPDSYDIVIVDAPATGHALALLEVPKIVSEAIHSGPLKDLAVKSLRLLTDKEDSGILIVSTPEEMPASEASVIKKSAGSLDINVLGLFLNRAFPEPLKQLRKTAVPLTHKKVIDAYLHIVQTLNKNSQTHVNFLKKVFGNKIIRVDIMSETAEDYVSNNISNYLMKKYDEQKK